MSHITFKHLRTATGYSQEAFSSLIGIGLDSVQSIEQGRLSVSERTARKAFIATGALPASLFGDSADQAIAWDQAPYTTAHFEAWRRLTKGDLLAGLNGGIAGLARFLDVLKSILCAAGAEDKLGRVQAALSLALFDVLFAEELQPGARMRAHADGHGQDFDRLATFAGRMDRKQHQSNQ